MQRIKQIFADLKKMFFYYYKKGVKRQCFSPFLFFGAVQVCILMTSAPAIRYNIVVAKAKPPQ